MVEVLVLKMPFSSRQRPWSKRGSPHHLRSQGDRGDSPHHAAV